MYSTEEVEGAENDDVRARLEKFANLRGRLPSLGTISRIINDAEYISAILGSYLPASTSPPQTPLPTQTRTPRRPHPSECPSKRRKAAAPQRQEQALFLKTQDEAFTAEECENKHRNIECYNCHNLSHEKGHYREECWAKCGGKEGKGTEEA